MRRRALAVAGPLLLAATLAGCSPHPATGEWQALEEGESEFGQLNVNFEGRADLYVHGEEEASRHCFWSATGKRTANLVCNPAEEEAEEERYGFEVTDGEAVLSRDGQVVTRFERRGTGH